ncbi:MAG: hypothetical protein ACREB7_15210 [Sphingopyxis sp.]
MMIVSLAGALALIGAAETAPAPPVSRWTLRDDPARCLLERQTVEPPGTLSIDTTPGSDAYRVAITGRDIKGATSLAPAALTFAPSPKRLDGRASVAKLPTGMPVIWMQGVAPAFLDELAGAETVTIKTSQGVGGSISVVGAVEAVKAFRHCETDQLIDWGADAAQFAPGGARPVALKNRDAWLSNTELMAVAKELGQSNIDAAFRVSVSADGVVDGCRAVADAIDKGVEAAACAGVLNKPLFVAAKDPGGGSVRGVATFRVALERRPSRRN